MYSLIVDKTNVVVVANKKEDKYKKEEKENQENPVQDLQGNGLPQPVISHVWLRTRLASAGRFLYCADTCS